MSTLHSLCLSPSSNISEPHSSVFPNFLYTFSALYLCLWKAEKIPSGSNFCPRNSCSLNLNIKFRPQLNYKEFHMAEYYWHLHCARCLLAA